MTTKNLDKFSVLIAVIAVALTISIMSLTSQIEKGDEQPIQEPVPVPVQADTLANPVPTTEMPAADSLEVQPAEENYMEDKDV